jgi:two-component system, NarL family, sensor histidine kinase UhpB
MLVPLAGFNIAAAMCLELGRRMLLSQAKLASYSDELASTVRAREAQLHVQFQALRRADAERTLSAERSRIMSDMHDGVGGQLAVLVHMADDPKIDRAQIVDVVRTGLADMRLVLDSLNHAGGDLLIALGTFRERIAPMLRANSIALRWRVDDTVKVDGLGPEVVLNLFRILQEAINNAVRHAQADSITVSIALDSNDVLLSVADNGKGFDVKQNLDGHYGLSGMHRRAEKIGAQLRVSSQASQVARSAVDEHESSGTIISLRLAQSVLNRGHSH